MSRTRNVQLNIYSGIINQIIINVLQFVNRTIFIWYLDANYLGINGLFTSVLSMLSLAELGIGSAIGFSMYKPLAEKNIPKIQALMSFYKNAYRIIGGAITIMGLALVPFLDQIVNFDEGVDINYYFVYILFLFNTVLSYLFFAYRGAIIVTDQKEYKIVKIKVWTTIASSALQLILLIIFRNYYLYLVVPIVIGIIKNILISRKAGKLYPYIDESNSNKLEKKEKKEIFKNVYALSLTKIGTVVYYSCDNIVISSFVGTFYTGLYSNYLIILNTVRSFINIIFGAFSNSVGNLNAIETSEKKKEVFERMLLINFWIYGFCAVALNQLFNPFIRLWIGKDYLFNDYIKFSIVLMFLVSGLCHTVTVFKDACGLFWQTRYRELITALVNVIISAIGVKLWGIMGVLIGTIVSEILIIYPIDPVVVFKNVFREKVFSYYKWMVLSYAQIGAVMLLVWGICKPFQGKGILNFIIQVLIVVVVTNVAFFIMHIKDKNLKYFLNLFLSRKK